MNASVPSALPSNSTIASTRPLVHEARLARQLAALALAFVTPAPAPPTPPLLSSRPTTSDQLPASASAQQEQAADHLQPHLEDVLNLHSLQLQNHEQQQQQSFSDWWQEYWSRQPFPSGYTLSSITMLACLITTIIFLIVVGNCLVCIAIFTEKSLKPTQNWFIASLAVSDMLLGLVVMPFSLARDLMGFWVFGPLWCDMHEALDVLLTTASINTLCLISLDRYWSITQAVSYLKKRTPRRGALMIAFVWVFSAAVSLPPLFGWKKQTASLTSGPLNSSTRQSAPSLLSASHSEPSERRKRTANTDRRPAMPSSQQAPSQMALERVEQQDRQLFYANLLLGQQLQQQQQAPLAQLATTTEYPTCQLSDDVGYVLYSAFGSFFAPCGVMVFTYIKIFLAARSRARRAINKQSRVAAAAAAAAAASEKKHTAAAAAAAHPVTSAGAQVPQRRTIGGTTGGRASKQLKCFPSPPEMRSEPQSPPVGGQSSTHRHSNSVMRASKLVVVERRKSLAGPQQQQQLVLAPDGATLTTSGAQQATASALKSDQVHHQQQADNQQSSLITVMSESMSELPITRFQFNAKQQQQQQSVSTLDPSKGAQGEQKVVALLQAISQAGEQAQDNQLVRDMRDESEHKRSEALESVDEMQLQQQAQNSNSTNETCFMTIEEDSDNLEAQTGRTIMMVAGNARSPLPSTAKAQAVTMTMQPAGQSTVSTPADNNTNSPVVCNNVACLRRQRQRAARASYCSSSMTINDDEEEEEDDEEEDDEEEEEEEEEDECIEDDLLTDDCNGYSCGLDPECGVHCRECATLGKTPAGDPCQDSPSTCQASTPGDSPRILACGHGHQQSVTTIDSSITQEHTCTHQHHGSPSKQRLRERHQPTSSSKRRRERCLPQQAQDEHNNESLTVDDNLSLTDYRSQDEDNDSSILGHDVLDATPLPPRNHPCDKRKSIVATAFATVTGRTPEPAGDRKKSSIGFRLGRLGSSSPAPLSNQTGGLLALAAASQQLTGGESGGQLPAPVATRNLKTLRQNFFHKLNQLTAKSAMRQQKLHDKGAHSSNGKSSAQSSYGSSYEPSIDCATTSNVHSNNDAYHQETTFGETDDYEQQTSGETRQSGGPTGDKLARATTAAVTTMDDYDEHKVNAADQRHQMQLNLRHESGSKLRHLAMDSYKQKVEQTFSPSHLHSQQIDNLSESLATNKRLLSTTTTTDDDSMLATSGGFGAGVPNMSFKNNMDLNSNTAKTNSTNNPLDRHLKSTGPHHHQHHVASGDHATTASAMVKKRSADRTAASTGGGGSGHHHQLVVGKADSIKQATHSTGGPASQTSRAYLASDNERHKRKLAKARERRATLILGVIMAAFICSWLPFFTFYVLRALCHVCRDYFSPRFEAFIFWVGYCNSAINPIIYTIFNRDFRRAFRKILFKCL